MSFLSPFPTRLSALLLATLLAGCDGGDDSKISNNAAADDALAQICSSNNPYRQDADTFTRIGTLGDEKRWIKSYMGRNYLWYRDMEKPVENAPAFSDENHVIDSLDAYFQALKTSKLSPSLRPVDQFSFIYPTRAWHNLSQSGVVLGYGLEWSIGAALPPRHIRVAYVEPGSPAALAGIQRGDELLTADGVSADATSEVEVDQLNAALFPEIVATHQFVLSRNGMTQPGLNLNAGEVTKHPVLLSKTLDSGGQKVGYIVFNDHLASAEAPLMQAVQQLKNQNVSDLVLDLRYNGGGYLFIANELAYMIAGPGRTQGKVFEQRQFNDLRPADTANSAFYFLSQSCGLNSTFHCTSQKPLPTLNLGRVYVLTSANTCSASESIINSLRGVDVDVKLIGDTTCGKPYAFTAKDNCGISYFPIESKGTNAKGFGDYADGFSPDCAAADDLGKALGDPAENLLATALSRHLSGGCPAAELARGATPAAPGLLKRGPARENRILLPQDH